MKQYSVIMHMTMPLVFNMVQWLQHSSNSIAATHNKMVLYPHSTQTANRFIKKDTQSLTVNTINLVIFY